MSEEKYWSLSPLHLQTASCDYGLGSLGLWVFVSRGSMSSNCNYDFNPKRIEAGQLGTKAPHELTVAPLKAICIIKEWSWFLEKEKEKEALELLPFTLFSLQTR